MNFAPIFIFIYFLVKFTHNLGFKNITILKNVLNNQIKSSGITIILFLVFSQYWYYSKLNLDLINVIYNIGGLICLLQFMFTIYLSGKIRSIEREKHS